APGAACAQASEIKPFMYAVREVKRAALCHSTALAPGAEESPGPLLEASGRDGGAQRVQQVDVEMQVVEGVEPRAEDLVAALEVAQVSAAEVAAGVTVPGGVDGTEGGGGGR